MNPYTWRTTIRDASAFVGRAAQLALLANLVATSQSCSVVGPRRIGKSSLLYHFAHTASADLPQVVAYLDLEELAGAGPDDFYALAIERLMRAGRGRPDADPARDGTAAGFRRWLARITEAGVRLGLGCDEFEMLSRNARFDPDFFAYLRGLCSNYNLALVTSSRVSLFELCHQGNLQSSQFWNIFVPLPLGVLTEAEARTLVAQPFARAQVPLDVPTQAFALNLAGRHPFFLQSVCYRIFEELAQGRPVDIAGIAQQFQDDARPHLAHTWDTLDETSRATLAQLAAAIEPCGLAHEVWQTLHHQAVVTGDASAARLESEGWRAFIRERVDAAARAVRPLARPNAAAGELRYADFDLRVESAGGRTCHVSVLNSPAGQAHATCTLPFAPEQIGAWLVDLGGQIARRATTPVRGEISPAAIGEGLFRAIFADAVGQTFFESVGKITERQGLRIKIHVDPERSPQIAGLPWEFLYNSTRRRFLTLSRETPVVRYLDVPAPTQRSRTTLPLRVLVVIASPRGLPALDLAHERAEILRVWGKHAEVQVELVEPATAAAVQARLWDWSPHVLHFMGHGQFDPLTGRGALVFADEANEAKTVTGAQLGVMLANAPSVRLAFFNACESATCPRHHNLDPFSGVAAALVLAGLPAVIAMQFPISDEAALIFAKNFYPRLAAGEPVDLAVTFGRGAIHTELQNSQEWGTPVLFMRVPDGQLFDLNQ